MREKRHERRKETRRLDLRISTSAANDRPLETITSILKQWQEAAEIILRSDREKESLRGPGARIVRELLTELDRVAKALGALKGATAKAAAETVKQFHDGLGDEDNPYELNFNLKWGDDGRRRGAEKGDVAYLYASWDREVIKRFTGIGRAPLDVQWVLLRCKVKALLEKVGAHRQKQQHAFEVRSAYGGALGRAYLLYPKVSDVVVGSLKVWTNGGAGRGEFRPLNGEEERFKREVPGALQRIDTEMRYFVA